MKVAPAAQAHLVATLVFPLTINKCKLRFTSRRAGYVFHFKYHYVAWQTHQRKVRWQRYREQVARYAARLEFIMVRHRII